MRKLEVSRRAQDGGGSVTSAAVRSDASAAAAGAYCNWSRDGKTKQRYTVELTVLPASNYCQPGTKVAMVED